MSIKKKYDELRIKLGQVAVNIAGLQYQMNLQKVEQNKLFEQVQELIEEEKAENESESK